ncbi:uncharacterized protein EV420DRAFT_1647269 [Desarmillaria tabescens]|uniref:CCHC-type domain-containing protein n=1 Tax=Armillaria tabescens TaxID=1929756 RepID=A0AA39JWC4_ARMTA|nr:uncharacterized protein EV420DRAFT_1647269 [Desarmillaria tabescens]KAK0448991.1 hypothetical protein EV420DRAFT_1647269 [Desarmillaria tabescens]
MEIGLEGTHPEESEPKLDKGKGHEYVPPVVNPILCHLPKFNAGAQSASGKVPDANMKPELSPSTTKPIVDPHCKDGTPPGPPGPGGGYLPDTGPPDGGGGGGGGGKNPPSSALSNHDNGNLWGFGSQFMPSPHLSHAGGPSDRGPPSGGGGGGGGGGNPPSPPPSDDEDQFHVPTPLHDFVCEATVLHAYDDFEEEDYDYRPIVVDELYSDLDIDPAMLCLMASSMIKLRKYHGKPDLPEFDCWFQGVIGWMRLIGHCGSPITHNDEGDPIPSSCDCQWKLVLHGFLSGATEHWYSTFIDRGRVAYKWMFLRVVKVMFHNFVYETTLCSASESYQAVKYSWDGGLHQLYADMVYHIQYMPSQPDVYNVCCNIMDKMPKSISDLLYDEGLSTELSSCPDIMPSPEEKFWGHALKLHVISDKQHKPPSPTCRKFSPPACPDTVVVKRKLDTTKGGMNWACKESDSSTRTCYHCGKPGHISTDPDCPMSVDGAEDMENPTESPNTEPEVVPEEPYGGSQYSSEYEAKIVEDPNDYGNDDEWNWAMRDHDPQLSEFLWGIREGEGSTNEANKDESVVSECGSHDEWSLDYPEFLGTIQESHGEFTPTLEPVLKWAQHKGTRPFCHSGENRCLSAWVEINGMKAFTLFDSGSTSDAISPDFVPVANICYFELTNPVILQLGTKGTVTIKDIEDMANGAVELELDSNNYQPDLQEVHEFIQEFTKEYYPQGQPTEEKLGRMAVDEAMHLASSRFKERTSEMGCLKKKDTPWLHTQWLESCKDILGGVPDKLPPL